MALVKLATTCNSCKQQHEQYDPKQMDDREYYLYYWNLPFEGPEADAAWEAKKKMTRQFAPTVISDIGGYISQVDGSYIDSKSKHRDHLKRHNMIELGNDYPKEQRGVEISSKSNRERKEMIGRQVYEKLRS